MHTVTCKVKRATVHRLTVPWKMHARFLWKPSPVEKHLTVQNVARPSPRLKIRTILQKQLLHLPYFVQDRDSKKNVVGIMAHVWKPVENVNCVC